MPVDMNDHFNGNKNSDDDKKNGNSGKNEHKPLFDPPDFMNNFNNLNGEGGKIWILYALLIFVMLFIAVKPYEIINSGEVGIKVTTGKFQPNSLNPGLHFYMPGIQKIIAVDTKIRVINYKNIEDVGGFTFDEGIKTNNAIMVLDKRGLTVSIELTVQYRLEPSKAPQTISTWGLSWEEKIINPVARDVVRNVVGNYKAEELPIKRNEIANAIASKIRAKIESLPNKPVALSSVQLREIVLPKKIKAQIEMVQIAKQETARVRNEVERTKQEAEKRIAEAKGKAEAVRVEAQGKADALLIDADAQAKANMKIGASLNSELLHLRQIEVQSRFNDALRENRDTKLFLTPGGAVPNIWIDSKSTQQATAVTSK